MRRSLGHILWELRAVLRLHVALSFERLCLLGCYCWSATGSDTDWGRWIRFFCDARAPNNEFG